MQLQKLVPLLSHEPVRLLYKLCLSSKKLLYKQIDKLIDNNQKTNMFFIIALPIRVSHFA